MSLYGLKETLSSCTIHSAQSDSVSLKQPKTQILFQQSPTTPSVITVSTQQLLDWVLVVYQQELELVVYQELELVEYQELELEEYRELELVEYQELELVDYQEEERTQEASHLSLVSTLILVIAI
ncbi:hypothetical protein AB205_0172030 [Aquarana catesbeiana]|uniref:Uncharacterized protein n=1 Tax=Aquarana catesbeiana TaxID=8400 RepID=A0A2G9S2S2_AQUCT|nr:hypothetical protein AB205_0172030 [Aquarana catesbeiana]